MDENQLLIEIRIDTSNWDVNWRSPKEAQQALEELKPDVLRAMERTVGIDPQTIKQLKIKKGAITLTY